MHERIFSRCSWLFLALSTLEAVACVNPTDMTNDTIGVVEEGDVDSVAQAVQRGTVVVQQQGIGSNEYSVYDVLFQVAIWYPWENRGQAVFYFENTGDGQARIDVLAAVECEDPAESIGNVYGIVLFPKEKRAEYLNCTRFVSAAMYANLDN